MPFYVKVGKVPPKRHITFYKEDGKSLYREELFSTKGFSGIYSNKYHLYMPPQVEKISEVTIDTSGNDWKEAPVEYYHFVTDKKQTKGNILSARNEFLKNDHCVISTAHINEDSDFFYRNSQMHEIVFVHHGKGWLLSEYGKIKFEEWDYLIIPKGTTYQLKFDDYKNNKVFIVESDTPYEIPSHFRNEYGQLTEEAPYYERDFRVPEFMEPVDKIADFKLMLESKRENV